MTTDPKTGGELQGDEYIATPEELQAIDAAIASIDAGETVSAAEIKAVRQISADASARREE